MTTVINHVPYVRFVKSLAASRGDHLAASIFAKAHGWNDLGEAIYKAVIDPVGAAGLLHPVAMSLAGVLRPLTIIGRLQGTQRVPLLTRILASTQKTVGAWVGEYEPIPVNATLLDSGVTLEPKRVASIAVLTSELMVYGDNTDPEIDRFIAQESVAGVVEAMDLAFIDPANSGSADKPASITHGATSFSSAGATLAQIDADLKRMLDSLTDADHPLTTATWIMSPKSAAYLSLLRGTGGAPAFPGVTARGGELLGLPALTSTACSASGSPGERFIALVEAKDVVLADENDVSVSIGKNASVQMDDEPGNGAQQMVSLWQLNLTGVRVTRHVNWRTRRASAAALLRDVTF